MIEQPPVESTTGTIQTPLGAVSLRVESVPSRYRHPEGEDPFQRRVYMVIRLPYAGQEGGRLWEIRFDKGVDRYSDWAFLWFKGSPVGGGDDRHLSRQWRALTDKIKETVPPLVDAWIAEHPEVLTGADMLCCWREYTRAVSKARSLREEAVKLDEEETGWLERYDFLARP